MKFNIAGQLTLRCFFLPAEGRGGGEEGIMERSRRGRRRKLIRIKSVNTKVII